MRPTTISIFYAITSDYASLERQLPQLIYFECRRISHELHGADAARRYVAIRLIIFGDIYSPCHFSPCAVPVRLP